jgi:hypothetical protein
VTVAVIALGLALSALAVRNELEAVALAQPQVCLAVVGSDEVLGVSGAALRGSLAHHRG